MIYEKSAAGSLHSVARNGTDESVATFPKNMTDVTARLTPPFRYNDRKFDAFSVCHVSAVT